MKFIFNFLKLFWSFESLKNCVHNLQATPENVHNYLAHLELFNLN